MAMNEQPSTKQCADCLGMFATNEYGTLVAPYFDVHETTCTRCGKPLVIEYSDDGRVQFSCPGHRTGSAGVMYGWSIIRCPRCHEERRKNNRQVYPLCQMCHTPTSVSGFLHEYQGHRLDLIRVCCRKCVPRFEALPAPTQMYLLQLAMLEAYGETAFIYALQYDDTFLYHHIGRTKHLKRRMAEYRRVWYREIKAYHILEEIPFGPLSMERESRWIMHALKNGWPIDNFDLFTSPPRPPGNERNREAEIYKKKTLITGVAHLEPLTCPFRQIARLIDECFLNACDAHIVNWFLEQRTGVREHESEELF